MFHQGVTDIYVNKATSLINTIQTMHLQFIQKSKINWNLKLEFDIVKGRNEFS